MSDKPPINAEVFARISAMKGSSDLSRDEISVITFMACVPHMSSVAARVYEAKVQETPTHRFTTEVPSGFLYAWIDLYTAKPELALRMLCAAEKYVRTRPESVRLTAVHFDKNAYQLAKIRNISRRDAAKDKARLKEKVEAFRAYKK